MKRHAKGAVLCLGHIFVDMGNLGDGQQTEQKNAEPEGGTARKSCAASVGLRTKSDDRQSIALLR